MKKYLMSATAAVAVAVAAPPALAQATAQDRIVSILGSLFGDRAGGTVTIESEWAAGRTPLNSQRAQFETKVDAEARAGALTQETAARLKYDYYQLALLENQYGADRSFSAAERTELSQRYGALTQVLSAGGYNDGSTGVALAAQGQAEFDRRVDASVAARRLTRTQGSRLKADYTAAVRLETGYLRDGVLSAAERTDLDARLDALDVRVGDTAPAIALTSRQRLDAIIQALPNARLGTPAQTRLQVEHGDLVRLESAYARLNPTAEERAYLESRLVDLETRVRLR
jgi:hypothetical protein